MRGVRLFFFSGFDSCLLTLTHIHRYARTRHLHERKGEFSECFFLDETQKNPIFQLFLSDENGIVNPDTEALPISSRPFRGNTSLNISVLWRSRAMWYVVVRALYYFLLISLVYITQTLFSNTNTQTPSNTGTNPEEICA